MKFLFSPGKELSQRLLAWNTEGGLKRHGQAMFFNFNDVPRRLQGCSFAGSILPACAIEKYLARYA